MRATGVPCATSFPGAANTAMVSASRSASSRNYIKRQIEESSGEESTSSSWYGYDEKRRRTAFSSPTRLSSRPFTTGSSGGGGNGGGFSDDDRKRSFEDLDITASPQVIPSSPSRRSITGSPMASSRSLPIIHSYR